MFCCGRAGIELDVDSEVEQDAEMSVKDWLLSLVARGLGVRKSPVEEECKPQSGSKWICVSQSQLTLLSNTRVISLPAGSSPESLKKLISETMVRWTQESEMEDPELVRAVFSLLHRQYQGLWGQMAGPLSRTYTISQASVEDTMTLLSSLGQIRSLLSVRMGKEEEKMMIRRLG